MAKKGKDYFGMGRLISIIFESSLSHHGFLDL